MAEMHINQQPVVGPERKNSAITLWTDPETNPGWCAFLDFFKSEPMQRIYAICLAGGAVAGLCEVPRIY